MVQLLSHISGLINKVCAARTPFSLTRSEKGNVLPSKVTSCQNLDWRSIYWPWFVETVVCPET